MPDPQTRRRPRAARWTIKLLQLDALVVLLQDLFVRRAVQRHAVGAHLAHADAVAPAAAVERHADDGARGVALDVEREQAVAQRRAACAAGARHGPAAGRTDDFGLIGRPDGPRSTTRMSVKSPIAERPERGVQFLPGLVHLPHGQPRIAIGRGIREIDPVHQHPDRVPLGAEVDQLAADPRALAASPGARRRCAGR